MDDAHLTCFWEKLRTASDRELRNWYRERLHLCRPHRATVTVRIRHDLLSRGLSIVGLITLMAWLLTPLTALQSFAMLVAALLVAGLAEVLASHTFAQAWALLRGKGTLPPDSRAVRESILIRLEVRRRGGFTRSRRDDAFDNCTPEDLQALKPWLDRYV